MNENVVRRNEDGHTNHSNSPIVSKYFDHQPTNYDRKRSRERSYYKNRYFANDSNDRVRSHHRSEISSSHRKRKHQRYLSSDSSRSDSVSDFSYFSYFAALWCFLHSPPFSEPSSISLVSIETEISGYQEFKVSKFQSIKNLKYKEFQEPPSCPKYEFIPQDGSTVRALALMATREWNVHACIQRKRKKRDKRKRGKKERHS